MESFFLIYFLQQISVEFFFRMHFFLEMEAKTLFHTNIEFNFLEEIFFHTYFYLEIIEKLLLHTNIEFIL